MKKVDLLFKFGGISLITVGALGLALTANSEDDSKVKGNQHQENFITVENTYKELVESNINKDGYDNLIEIIKIEEENKRLEEERVKELAIAEQKKKELEEKNNLGEFNVSWYTATCKGCIGITKTGYDVRNTIKYEGLNIVAVDPKVIPLYSIIEIEGHGKHIALDVGGAIKHHRLDILTDSYSTAIRNGRQYLDVKVIRWGKGDE